MFERVTTALAMVLCLALGVARGQSPSPDEGRVFVLVVGVEDYSDPKITDLHYAEDDAQAVYEFFAKDPKSPTTAARVKLLRGAAATQRGIRRAIRDHLIRQATGPQDTAIFYFAGHGFADAYGVYLGTVDTKLVELELSALAWSDLQRDWSRISAGRRVFIADACHSGGLEGLRGPGGIGKRVLALKPKTGSVSVTLAATAANQLSAEDKKSGHGVFTASLLKGLRGGADGNQDGAVSLGELAQHLSRDVPRRAKAAGGNQTPEVSYVGDAPLGKEIRLSQGAESPQKGSARSAAEERALRAELENAELREKLAQLQGKNAEAEVAGAAAAKARRRLEALGAPTAGPRAERIRLRPAPYVVGETHRDQGTVEIRARLRDDEGGFLEHSFTRAHDRVFEVTSVEGSLPSRLKTSYLELDFVSRGDRVRRHGKEVTGKTFLTRLNRRGRLRHTDAKGDRVDNDFADDELDRAAAQVLKAWPPLVKALARVALAPGDSVHFGGTSVQPLLELPEDGDLSTQVFRFKYQGTRGSGAAKVAVFEVELRLGPSEGAGNAFEITLRGGFSVYVESARLAGFDLKGPVVFRGGEDREVLAGSGTMRVTRKIRVNAPR